MFAQPDAEMVDEQHTRIVAGLEERFPDAAELLDEAAADLLAFTSFLKEHWRQLWSNNSLERLQGDPPPRRRRRHLPRPRLDHPPRRLRPRRTERRMAVASRRYVSVGSITKALTEPHVDEPEEVIAIAQAA